MSRGPFWGIIYFSGKSRFFSIIFECWDIFFWRVRHNCMLRVRILLEGKQFFSKIFFTTFRKWAWFFPAFGKKNFGRLSRRQSICPKEWLKAKVCLKKRLLLLRFRTLRKWFFALWKKLGKVSQMQPTCTLVQFDENFCLKILVFLSFLDI